MSASIFSPLSLGVLQLPQRVVMAPMARARCGQPGDVPGALMASYYAQRASAGLIVSEAAPVSRQGQGHSLSPGLYSPAQVQGWRRVTDAVHAQGGRIVAQLGHAGRLSHPVLQDGQAPVGPSALAAEAAVWVLGEDGLGHRVDCPVPRALAMGEIAAIVEDFRLAAANALRAGFDGVEIHGAHGGLLDQFMRTPSNTRSDVYGGSRGNRVRLLLEVARAVCGEVGAPRVGVRLSPHLIAHHMDCPDAVPTAIHAARALSALGVAYLHLAEADRADAPRVPESFRRNLRAAFAGRLIVAGGYDLARAQAMLASKLADAVAFGRPFIANPDLPTRFQHGLPLATRDPGPLLGGQAQGYTSYPAWADIPTDLD